MYKKDFLRKNQAFIAGWFVMTLILGAFLIIYGKEASFVLLNPYHSPTLNIIFRAATFLGDGWFIIGLALIFFLARKKQLAFLTISSYAISGIIVQVLKYFFPSSRPKLFFETNHLFYPYFPDSITLHTIHSFPSGHTASAFALAASIAFLASRKAFSMPLLLLAMLIGYSRIYLGQHFPEDVIAGAAIGIFAAIACYSILEYISRNKEKPLKTLK